MPHTILIVEDNRKLAALFHEALAEHFNVRVAFNLKQAQNKLAAAKEGVQGVLLDIHLPDGDGLGLITHIKSVMPKCVIIVVTAYGTIQKAVQALKIGAADFLEKPVDLEGLVQRFQDLLPSRATATPIAASPKMIEILAMADRVAPTGFPVLITGETGTGKEVLARYIHQQSGRKKMLALNCATIPRELADSLLFGHLKGSFTGAVEGKKGLVASAEDGTLFLDEIGELPLELQPKLLRFLDSGLYLPIGESVERQSNARIIAASNKDLFQAVKNGAFREDLYFRLFSFPIMIPPLRSRREDIEPLVQFHLKRLKETMGKDVAIDADALEMLKKYHFPGNIRELFNLLDRSAVLTGGHITARSLKPLLLSEEETTKGDFWGETKALAQKKEKEIIIEALNKAGGNKAAAARDLKISYKTLLNKMKKFGL